MLGRHVYRVRPTEQGWTVTKEGEDHPRSAFSGREEAIAGSRAAGRIRRARQGHHRQRRRNDCERMALWHRPSRGVRRLNLTPPIRATSSFHAAGKPFFGRHHAPEGRCARQQRKCLFARRRRGRRRDPSSRRPRASRRMSGTGRMSDRGGPAHRRLSSFRTVRDPYGRPDLAGWWCRRQSKKTAIARAWRSPAGRDFGTSHSPRSRLGSTAFRARRRRKLTWRRSFRIWPDTNLWSSSYFVCFDPATLEAYRKALGKEA